MRHNHILHNLIAIKLRFLFSLVLLSEMTLKMISWIKNLYKRLRHPFRTKRPTVVVIGVWAICLFGACYQISTTVNRFMYSSKTYINMDYSTIYHIPDMSICMDFVYLIDPLQLVQQKRFMRDLIELLQLEANTVDPPNESTTETYLTTTTAPALLETYSNTTILNDSYNDDISSSTPGPNVDFVRPIAAELDEWLHDSSLHASIYSLLDQHMDASHIFRLLRPADTLIVDLRVPSNRRPGYLRREELRQTYRRREYFKGKQICYTFSALRKYRLHRINLLELRSRGVIFELQLNASAMQRVPYLSVYLHEQAELPRNYQSSLFEVLESRSSGACIYGLTYNRYVHRLQRDCRSYKAPIDDWAENNDQLESSSDTSESHSTLESLVKQLQANQPRLPPGAQSNRSNKVSLTKIDPQTHDPPVFRSQAEAVEYCVNERTYARLQSAFWNNVYSPVGWKHPLRIGFVSQVLGFDRQRESLAKAVDECESQYMQRECQQQMFVPLLKTALALESPLSRLVLSAPLEPEIAIRVGRDLSAFELFVYIGSVLTCWLAFTVVTCLHSLLHPFVRVRQYNS